MSRRPDDLGDALEEQVRDILAELLGGDIDEMPMDASLFEDLGADSLDIVELSMLLEQKFGLEEVDEGALERWVHVRDVVAYVRKRQRQAEAS